MKVEIERESEGRWLGEIPDLPGVMAYGQSRQEAVAKLQTLALRVIADRLEHGETCPPSPFMTTSRLVRACWPESRERRA